MGNATAAEREVAAGKRSAAPYPPSWVDRFTDWVDRLAGPSWLFYAGLWLVLYLIEFVTQSSGGTAATFHPFHIFFVGMIPLSLGLIHYLDRTADAALVKFRPVLDSSDADYADLRYRLTTLPARPALVAALLSVLFDFVFPTSDALAGQLFVQSQASLSYNTAVGFVVGLCLGVLIYHTLHQLIAVSQIYRHAHVNLFHLGPLYTFSNLSARTAIGVLALVYTWYAAVPEFFNELTSVVSGVFFLGVTVVTFIWPLLGVHNLLVEEKVRLIAECARRQEAAIARLHQRIDAEQLEGMDDLNKTMASLEIEHTTLRRISSWPWQPETVRWFVAALLFPVIVWLMQWVLQRVLGS